MKIFRVEDYEDDYYVVAKTKKAAIQAVIDDRGDWDEDMIKVFKDCVTVSACDIQENKMFLHYDSEDHYFGN